MLIAQYLDYRIEQYYESTIDSYMFRLQKFSEEKGRYITVNVYFPHEIITILASSQREILPIKI